MIWTTGLGELRSTTARRAVATGLMLLALLVSTTIEVSVADRGRQAAWHLLGLLLTAILAWGAKMLARRRELDPS